MSDQKFTSENKDFLIKQSEMLQAIISRMASNSLTIKQLGLTLWTTLVGFGFANNEKPLFFLALTSFLLLGFLDSYYLYLEKRFRDNFNQLTEILCGFSSETIENIQNIKGNFIALKPLDRGRTLKVYSATIISWSNFPYLVILLVTLIILVAT
ncbi:MAG: hypothetical protein WBA57_09300 [Elainellaceae cyanobacterium]